MKTYILKAREPAYDEDGTLLQSEYDYVDYDELEDPYDAGDFWNTRL